MQNAMSHKRCWGSKTQLGQKLGASPDSSDVWQTTTTHRMQHWELISPGWTYFCLSMPAGFDGSGCGCCIDFPMLLNRSMNWHAIVHRRPYVCASKESSCFHFEEAEAKKGYFCSVTYWIVRKVFGYGKWEWSSKFLFEQAAKVFFLQLPSSLLF